MELTQKCVREIFDYREDGALIWKTNRSSTARAGDVAGCLNADGYRVIRINKILHLAHRLVFLWHHGHSPEQVDHDDTVKSNNRIINLRAATNQQNMCNRGKQSNNKSGFKGVSWHKRTQKWMGRISVNGKPVHLGLHATPELAAAAYAKAAAELHGQFARAI